MSQLVIDPPRKYNGSDATIIGKSLRTTRRHWKSLLAARIRKPLCILYLARFGGEAFPGRLFRHKYIESLRKVVLLLILLVWMELLTLVVIFPKYCRFYDYTTPFSCDEEQWGRGHGNVEQWIRLLLITAWPWGSLTMKRENWVLATFDMFEYITISTLLDIN